MTYRDMSRRAKRVRDDAQDENLKTARAWCSTFYLRSGKLVIADNPQSAWRYAISQLEECPDTGRLHWQAYSEYQVPVRRASVPRDFEVLEADGSRRPVGKSEFHGERRFGSRDQARDYCRKDDTHVPGDGNRIERGTRCNSLCFWTYGVYDWKPTAGDPCAECWARDDIWQSQLAVWDLIGHGEVTELPCPHHSIEADEWPFLTLVSVDQKMCNCRIVAKTKL